MTSINFVTIAFLTVALCLSTAVAEQCIGNPDVLRELDLARGNNNSIPVTYIICPNTVFDFDNPSNLWEMNGNTNYLCGADGSSKNNCTVTGGNAHFTIYSFTFNDSSKENILVSGFTFEKARFISGIIAAWGKHTFRDCIFKVSEM